jgi:predicted nucleotidyltransferase
LLARIAQLVYFLEREAGMISQKQIDACIAVAKRLILFGSALTNKESAQDIDFISTGIQGWSIYEMAALMEHAAHALVDVVPEEQGTAFVDYNIKRGKVIYEQG